MRHDGIPADASAIIYLAKAGGLGATHACFGPLLMSPAVWTEVVVAGSRHGRGDVLTVEQAVKAGHIERPSLHESRRRRARGLARRFDLGAGESEVLALASDFELVLLDDHRATRAGKALGIASIETVLIPVFCAQAGVLDTAASLGLLDAIAQHTTVRAELATRVRQLIEEVRP